MIRREAQVITKAELARREALLRQLKGLVRRHGDDVVAALAERGKKDEEFHGALADLLTFEEPREKGFFARLFSGPRRWWSGKALEETGALFHGRSGGRRRKVGSYQRTTKQLVGRNGAPFSQTNFSYSSRSPDSSSLNRHSRIVNEHRDGRYESMTRFNGEPVSHVVIERISGNAVRARHERDWQENSLRGLSTRSSEPSTVPAETTTLTINSEGVVTNARRTRRAYGQIPYDWDDQQAVYAGSEERSLAGGSNTEPGIFTIANRRAVYLLDGRFKRCEVRLGATPTDPGDPINLDTINKYGRIESNTYRILEHVQEDPNATYYQAYRYAQVENPVSAGRRNNPAAVIDGNYGTHKSDTPDGLQIEWQHVQYVADQVANIAERLLDLGLIARLRDFSNSYGFPIRPATAPEASAADQPLTERFIQLTKHGQGYLLTFSERGPGQKVGVVISLEKSKKIGLDRYIRGEGVENGVTPLLFLQHHLMSMGIDLRDLELTTSQLLEKLEEKGFVRSSLT